MIHDFLKDLIQPSAPVDVPPPVVEFQNLHLDKPLYQNMGNGFLLVDPNDIDMSAAFDLNNPDFWNKAGRTKQDYTDFVDALERVYEELDRGVPLEKIQSMDYPDSLMSKAANAFFQRSSAVTVDRDENGNLSYNGGGRHRILEAQEQGVRIPVRVVHDDYAQNDQLTELPDDISFSYENTHVEVTQQTIEENTVIDEQHVEESQVNVSVEEHVEQQETVEPYRARRNEEQTVQVEEESYDYYNGIY